MSIGGLFMRAAGNAVAAHEIAQRGVVVAQPRPGRDGQTPATERELVQMFEEEMAGKERRFVSMLEEQNQPRNAVGKGL